MTFKPWVREMLHLTHLKLCHITNYTTTHSDHDDSTLNIRHVSLILVNFTAVNSEAKPFQQLSSLFILSLTTAEQIQWSTLSDDNPRCHHIKNQSINQWINESMNESMNEWINQSMNQSINRSHQIFWSSLVTNLPESPLQLDSNRSINVHNSHST